MRSNRLIPIHAALLAACCLVGCQSGAPTPASRPNAPAPASPALSPSQAYNDVATVPPSVLYVKPASVIPDKPPENAAQLEDAAARKSKLTGSAAPDFKLVDQDAKEVTLADYRGKWLVLYFYPLDDTPTCTCHATEFTESLHQFRAMDAQIVGISPDTPSMHAFYVAKYSLAIRVLSDMDYTVAKKYGSYFDSSAFTRTDTTPAPATTKPPEPKPAAAKPSTQGATAVVDPFSGELKPSVGVKSPIIRSTFIIDPRGVIVWHCPAIIPQGHANRIREKLKALQAMADANKKRDAGGQ